MVELGLCSRGAGSSSTFTTSVSTWGPGDCGNGCSPTGAGRGRLRGVAALGLGLIFWGAGGSGCHHCVRHGLQSGEGGDGILRHPCGRHCIQLEEGGDGVLGCPRYFVARSVGGVLSEVVLLVPPLHGVVLLAPPLPLVPVVRCYPRRRPVILLLHGPQVPTVSRDPTVAVVPVMVYMPLPWDPLDRPPLWVSGGCTGLNSPHERLVELSRNPGRQVDGESARVNFGLQAL